MSDRPIPASPVRLLDLRIADDLHDGREKVLLFVEWHGGETVRMTLSRADAAEMAERLAELVADMDES